MNCTETDRRMIGYFVCVHVLDGAPLYHFVPARGRGPRLAGEMFCRACFNADEQLPIDGIKVICRSCADLIRACTDTVH